ncbi:hypothetical protein QAD02_002368 [Eretmocerus hayati]|uniref:Uncharacterized protein n=1 Tax=Eretmocerus hayati TaxID=131215 RepID=A0ACC2NIN6_9HYME|nr:hypothetical protein QAD02_002368 [Eretmocerus hayati]
MFQQVPYTSDGLQPQGAIEFSHRGWFKCGLRFNTVVAKKLKQLKIYRKKWENYRKTFRINEEKKSKYYIRHLLTFLKPHLGSKCGTDDKSDDSKTSENNDEPDRSENNESLSVEADKKTNNEATDQGRKHKLKEVQNKDAPAGKSQKQMPEHEIISPRPSGKYFRDEAKITKLEEDTMGKAAETVKVMETVITSNNKEENESIFLNTIL